MHTIGFSRLLEEQEQEQQQHQSEAAEETSQSFFQSICSNVSFICNGCITYGLFGYFTPFMSLAKEQGSTAVRPDQLPKLWPSDDLVKWSYRFNSSTSSTQRESRGSCQLLWTLYRTFWLQFFGILLIKLATTLLSLWSIVLMSRFLRWQEKSLETVTIAERNKGLLAGAGILLLELVNIIGGAQCNFWAQRCGLRVQGVLAAGLFKRVIRSPQPASKTELIETGPKASAYNLLMIDIPSIAEFVFSLIDLLILPLRIVLSFQLLLYQVGSSAMAGLFCLICLVVIILGLQIQSGFLKAPYLRHRDVRISRAHDIMSDIRSLRMVGWEDIAADSIKHAREKEIYYRKRRMYLDSLSASFSNGAYAVTQVAIFMAYVIWGLKSDANFVFKASVAIPVMQVVGRLVGPLTNFPFLINSIVEGQISIQRYETYIFGSHQPNATSIPVDPDSVDITPLSSPSSTSKEDVFVQRDSNEHLIVIEGGLFSWIPWMEMHDGELSLEERLTDEYIALGESGTTIMSPISSVVPTRQRPVHLFGDSIDFIPRYSDSVPYLVHERRTSFCLRVPSLHVKAQECLAILGAPGSGKSSLLLALLGEMPRISGCLKLSRTAQRQSLVSDGRYEIRSSPVVGYASQIPWIPGGTIRSAILFGRPFIDERYKRVIDACELQPDFDSWPEGDSRVISEGGSSLSGGQRARVALARAIYDYPEPNEQGGTKVFLLDGPFASTDPRVGSNIFKKLFGLNGLIKNAAVILTIDEVNLRFLLNSMEQLNIQLSINLKTRIMDKGMLSEIEGPSIYRIEEPISQSQLPQTKLQEKALPWESESIKQSHEEKSSFIEQAYSGVVGHETYKWYSRYAGYGALLLMATVIIAMHLTETGSDFWIAHWTAMAPEDKGKALPKELKKHVDLPEKPSVASVVDPVIKHRMPDSSSFIEVRRRSNMNSLQGSLQPDNDNDQQIFIEMGNLIGFNLLSSFPNEIPKDEVNISALAVFIVLSSLSTMAVIILYLVGTFSAIKAAISIHSKLLSSVINAPFWLYDFFPIGIMINRFSADTEVVDGGPIFSMSYFFGSCVHVCIIVIALAALSPWCTPLIPIAGIAVYTLVYSLYRPTCREFQRSKLLALSPLCSNLSEAESGAVVIRALGAQRFYSQQNLHLTTNLLKTQFMQIGSNNWATTRLHLLAYPFTIINSVVPVVLRLLGLSAGAGILQSLFHEAPGSSMAGFVGLAISFALNLPSSIGAVVWSISLLEQKMCSVQRLKEVVSEIATTIDAEGRTVIASAIDQIVVTSARNLPQRRTGIQLRNVEVSYQRLRNPSIALDPISMRETQRFARENLPAALSGITIDAQAGEHIGIIGRNGAGKSTLLLALLNLVPISKGNVTIDGIPISSLSRSVLNKIIGVLPQSVIIQKGWTVRKFLDPRDEFTQDALLDVLRSAGLAKVVAALPFGMDTVIVNDECNRNYDTSILSVNESTATRHLSDTQLRLLSLGRLALHANEYRLVLVDEPPLKQVTKLGKSIDDAEVRTIRHRPIAGEQGATSDISESEEGSVIEDGNDEEIEVSDLLKKVFPLATVIIVAHHASTLKKCDSVWVLSSGKLVARCEASSVTTQQSLMEIILAHEQQ